jgi:DNA-binding transcriptional regulator YiaG
MTTTNDSANPDSMLEGRNCYTFPTLADFEISVYRQSLGMSQSEFALAHNISVSTLRSWERHASEPSLRNPGVKEILSSWINQQFLKLNPVSY